jgi:hypothetical protein
MSNLQSIKDKLNDMSSKQNVLSQEALFAKAVTEEDMFQREEEEKIRQDKQALLMQEFNRSINMLMHIFKVSNFDAVMGMATAPARLLILNFFVAFIRGVGFAFGVLIMALLVHIYLPGYFF